jgi:DNA-binding CsgD family transcriptional regulator
VTGCEIADLTSSVLDGGFESPPWSQFLERLRLATRSDYASLSFRPPGRPHNPVLHLYAGAKWPPSVDKFYVEQFHRADPLPYLEIVEGKSYGVDELLRADEPAHAAYYEKVLVPGGTRELRLMRVTEASGVNAWLTVARNTGAFEPAVAQLMDGLAPYLRSSLRSFVALERERFAGYVANEAIRRLQFGWFTLDARGCVLEADAQGEKFLAAPGVLRRRSDGCLGASSKALEAEISGAVEALTADPRSRPRAIILSREPWADMLLAPMRKELISARGTPAMIAYVHRDGWSSEDRCEQLAELFRLRPSEARLALALSHGLTISQAAQELGLTLETARTYTKSIYGKLGASGQADLIRLILRSVLVIA